MAQQVNMNEFPGVALVRLPFDIGAQAVSAAYILTVVALVDVGIIKIGADRRNSDDQGKDSQPAGFGVAKGGKTEAAKSTFGFSA